MRGSAILLTFLCWFVEAKTATEGDTSEPITPVRLHDIDQCPNSPKPTCSDADCDGGISISTDQFRCRSSQPTTNPNVAPDHPLATLQGCRCCPLMIHVSCSNYDCRAPEGTRICISDQLEGCACMTQDDRRRQWEVDSAEQGPLLRDPEDLRQEALEIDYLSDYSDHAAENSTAATTEMVVMETMRPLDWRGFTGHGFAVADS